MAQDLLDRDATDQLAALTTKRVSAVRWNVASSIWRPGSNPILTPKMKSSRSQRSARPSSFTVSTG